MDDRFFEKPILNSPYAYPARHWELDSQGQSTQRIIESRRRVELNTPIPKPKKRKKVYRIEADFEAKLEAAFNQMIEKGVENKE